MASKYYEMRKLWESIPASYLSSNGPSIQQLIDAEEKVLLGFPYFYVIYDHSIPKMLHVSQHVKDILKLDASDILNGGENLIYDKVVEADKEGVMKAMEFIWKECLHVDMEKYLNCSFNLTDRMWGKYGVMNILHQTEFLTMTNAGHAALSFTRIIDITALKTNQHFVKMTVIEKSDSSVIAEKIFTTKKNNSLTKREKEIYELVNKGFSSKDISNKLTITYETVATHRKNIKRKLYE